MTNDLRCELGHLWPCHTLATSELMASPNSKVGEIPNLPEANYKYLGVTYL